MNDTTAPAEPLRKRRWFRRVAIAFGTALAVVVALVLLLPTIASWQIKTRLEDLGAKSVTVEDLEINPATGEIAFREFRSVGPDGAEITVGPARLRVHLAAFAGRRVTVSALSIADAQVTIRYHDDGRWSIAGLPMEFGTNDDDDHDDDEPWDLVSDNVAVDGSVVTLEVGDTAYTASLDRLRIGALSTLAPDSPAPIELEGRTDGGKLSLKGTAKPFLDAPEAKFDLRVAGIAIDSIKPALTFGRINDIAGTIDLDGALSISAGSGGAESVGYNGTLSLTKLRMETTLFRTRAEAMSWDGNAEMLVTDKAAAGESLPTVRVRGKASSERFQFFNKASKTALSSRTAMFDMSESGIRLEPDAENPDTSRIVGKLNAELEAAYFVQPESGLRVAAKRLATTGDATLVLPPGTADFTAELGGTMEADGLKGEMKTAGLETLDATSLRLSYRGLSLRLTANGAIETSTTASLRTEGFSVSIPSSSIRARAAAISGEDEKLAFSRTADGVLTLTLEGPLSAADLHASDTGDTWSTDQRSFTWDGKIEIGGNAFGRSNWNVDGALKGGNVEIALPQAGASVSVDGLSWTGAAGASSEAGSLRVGGEAQLDKMAMNLTGDERMMATLGSLGAQRIDIAGDDTKVGRLSITEFDARPETEGSALPRAALRSLVIEGFLSRGGDRIEVGTLRGTGGQVRLTRRKDGSLAFPGSSGSSDNGNSGRQAAAEGSKSEGGNSEPPAFRIGEAVLAETSLAFADRTMEPPFELETSRFQFSVKEFDTAEPESNARIDMLAGLGRFGRVQASGTVKPDTRKISADLGIGFTGIELFKFNPYLEPVLNHTVRQGRADGDLSVDIRKDKLNAHAAITLSRIEVRRLPGARQGSQGRAVGSDGAGDTDSKAGRGGGSSGPPIETAIALLQDEKGTIRLNIPVTGSLEDPQFDLSDAVGQAVGNALKQTVLTAVKIAFPLGAVFAVVDSMGNSQISIKPLLFPAGSAELTPELMAKIDEVGVYLGKQEEVSPSVCGYATRADVEALAKKDVSSPEEAALDLAQKRMDAVQSRLIEKHGVAQNRLFTCALEIQNSAEARPRVEIDL